MYASFTWRFKYWKWGIGKKLVEFCDRAKKKVDCKKCIEFQERKDKDYDCAKCLPELSPKNREIIEVYSLCHDQFIIGPSGPVSLNLTSVFKIMDLLKVKDKKRCLKMVKMLASLNISDIQAEIKPHGR